MKLERHVGKDILDKNPSRGSERKEEIPHDQSKEGTKKERGTKEQRWGLRED